MRHLKFVGIVKLSTHDTAIKIGLRKPGLDSLIIMDILKMPLRVVSVPLDNK